MTNASGRIQYQETEPVPFYSGPYYMSDINNIRLRHPRLQNTPETISQHPHLVLSTGDYQPNEANIDVQSVQKAKHNKIHITLLICTALTHVLYALRVFIPDNLPTYAEFLSNLKPLPIRRVYTPDFRPDLTIENSVVRFAETCQALWLVYILTYIPRSTRCGHVYRHPDIFNSLFCLLLLSSLCFQILSQTLFLSQEISCVCLFVSFILLVIVCRLIAVKLIIFEDKIESIDFVINRYFLLNCLFLYTTSIIYATICASIEYFTFYLDEIVKIPTLPTTIGLTSIYLLLIVFFLFDLLMYEKEFRSVWTPYLFVGVIFVCPPLRQFLSSDTHLITDGLNYYLLWTIFITTIIMTIIRFWRAISSNKRNVEKATYTNTYFVQESLETGYQ